MSVLWPLGTVLVTNACSQAFRGWCSAALLRPMLGRILVSLTRRLRASPARVWWGRTGTCITTDRCELLVLTDAHAGLLRDIAAEGALFVPESCTRVLCKPPATRSASEVTFLRCNLVPAVPFLRELPDFVSATLVQHLRLKSVMTGDVVAKQGQAASEVMLVTRGELRAYVHDRPTLNLWDVFCLARQLAAVQSTVASPAAAGTERRGSRERSGDSGTADVALPPPREQPFGSRLAPPPRRN